MTIPVRDRARAAGMVTGIFAAAGAVLVVASLLSGSTPERPTFASPPHAGPSTPAPVRSTPRPSPTDVLRNLPVHVVPVSQVGPVPHARASSTAPTVPEPGRSRPPHPSPKPSPTPVPPVVPPPPPVTGCTAARLLTIRLPLGVPCDTLDVAGLIKVGGTG